MIFTAIDLGGYPVAEMHLPDVLVQQLARDITWRWERAGAPLLRHEIAWAKAVTLLEGAGPRALGWSEGGVIAEPDRPLPVAGAVQAAWGAQ